MNLHLLFLSLLLLFTFSRQDDKVNRISDFYFHASIENFINNNSTEDAIASFDNLKIKESTLFCRKKNLDTTIAFFCGYEYSLWESAFLRL